MSVIGSNKRLIFCEGDDGSLDRRLLNRMLKGKPPTSVIVPAGGKHQMRAFVRGRLSVEKSAVDYVALRDRDFDVEPPSQIGLIPVGSGGAVFMLYRSAIENYMLESVLIHQYWQWHSVASNAPGWSHGVSPGEEDIQQWIAESADRIINYQAARWALAKLKPGARWPEVATTWTTGSGQLPASLTADDCVDAAVRLIDEFGKATSDVTESRFKAEYARFVDTFSEPGFQNQSQFLVWFHGKDLQKAMQQLRPNTISLKHFLDWAVENLDWSLHPDLLQLSQKI